MRVDTVSAGGAQRHMEEVQGIDPHDLCNGTDKPTQCGNFAHMDDPDQQGGHSKLQGNSA
jgi:hypothetical protein